MGCGGSSAAAPPAAPPQKPAQAMPIVTAQPMPQGGAPGGAPQAGAPPVKPKAKARPPPRPQKVSKFQITLENHWQDYDNEEDMVLKRAYLVGLPNAKFQLRGQRYEYNFTTMMQKNLGTGKERKIRPPMGMKPPPKALLPPGPMVVIKVPPGMAGKTVEIEDPNNPGRKVAVNVPPGARPGQKMAVPIPAKGETVQQVQEKQKGHSAAGKLAMGVGGIAVVGGLAVGGVILGEHLSDGAVSEWAGGTLGEGAGEAVADATAWTEGAVADAGEWAEGAAADAGEWAEGAAADAGEWAEGAGKEIADFSAEAVDWLGDAAEDAGDFIMDLF